MALKYLLQAERKLSGRIQALLTDTATTMQVDNPPSPSKIPTVFELNPESNDAESVRVVGVSGNILTIERGVYSSGVGTEHAAQTPYEEIFSSEHWRTVVEAIETGYITEDDSLTFVRNSATQFTINGIDHTAFYTAGRLLRLNSGSYMIVASSVFTLGNTVVTVTGTAVPTPITKIELSIQPQGNTNAYAAVSSIQNSSYTFAVDAGGDDAYEITVSPIPAAYVTGQTFTFKPSTNNTGSATLNVNNLGAKTIKTNVNQDLTTGQIKDGQIVTVVYDGSNFQIVSILASLNTSTGWTAPTLVTPTRTTVDDPTYILTFTGVDLTGTVSAGMKFRLVQNVTTLYGFITNVVLSTGNTIVTVYGGTDYDIGDTGVNAISAFVVSSEKAPFGFPLNPDKWTIEVSDTTLRQQASPVSGTWYNPGGITINIPIGLWSVEWYAIMGSTGSGETGQFYATLNTANNAGSQTDHLTASAYTLINTGAATGYFPATRRDVINLTVKDDYFLNIMNTAGGLTEVSFQNDNAPAVIRAICAYL